MKRRAILTLVAAGGLSAAAALLAADATPGPQPQIPRQSADLAIQMPGKQVHLSQYRGYVCALAVMSTTCPHCQHLAQVLAFIQQEFSSKGVQVLGVVINAEANTDLPNFRTVFGKNMYPIGMSTDTVVKPFLEHPASMMYFPMMEFIDKQGVVRGEHLGATDPTFFAEQNEMQNIRAELNNILNQPVIQLPAAKKK